MKHLKDSMNNHWLTDSLNTPQIKPHYKSLLKYKLRILHLSPLALLHLVAFDENPCTRDTFIYFIKSIFYCFSLCTSRSTDRCHRCNTTTTCIASPDIPGSTSTTELSIMSSRHHDSNQLWNWNVNLDGCRHYLPVWVSLSVSQVKLSITTGQHSTCNAVLWALPGRVVIFLHLLRQLKKRRD